MSDPIDRQAAIDAIMGEPTDAHYPAWYAERIKRLPSAQPERKTGRWILHKDKNGHTYGECSECGMRQWVGLMKYCSDCGVKMEIEHE